MDVMLEATAAAEERHFWFLNLRRTARRLLVEHLRGRQPRQIVDCGCGTGRNLDWLSTLGPALGVELTWTGLKVARAHGRRVIQGSVTHLPLATGSADVVTSFDVFYCLPDDAEQAALAEMHRVLEPGGLALWNVAALNVLRGAHSTMSMEVRRYTRRELKAHVEAAGFTVERLSYTNFVTFPLTLAVRLKDRVTGEIAHGSTNDLQVPPAPINAALDAALAAESQMLRVANMPIGSSLICLARRR